ncbi:conserved hypothetical protein [[Clostridium] ultunense Esp]|nr:conserved hypothetical protein [[Clostridium] ultunense Esp]
MKEDGSVKIYTGEKSLRMVGKAWQVRAKLRELSRIPITLHQFLLLRKGKEGKERNW